MLAKAYIPAEIKEKEVWQKSDHGAKNFLNILNKRIWQENRNFILAIVGETGAGKSYTALAIAEMIDINFSIDKVVYKPREFFQVLDKADSGSVIIFDEAGVGIPSREWQTIQNKMLSYVLQVFRHRRIGLILTTPSMNFIDKQIRILTNYSIKVRRIHWDNMTTECVIYERLHDHVRDITDWVKWVQRFDGKELDLNPVFFGKPSDDLAEAYEEMSKRRKLEIEKDANETLTALEEGIHIKTVDGRHFRKMMNLSAGFYKLYTHLKSKGFTNSDIAGIMGVSTITLRNWINWIQREVVMDDNKIKIEE